MVLRTMEQLTASASSGGTTAYTYAMEQQVRTTATASGLNGRYIQRDRHGCKRVYGNRNCNRAVTQPAALVASYNWNTYYGTLQWRWNELAAATASATGGTTELTLTLWSTGAATASATGSGLSAGTLHRNSVSDANGLVRTPKACDHHSACGAIVACYWNANYGEL